MKNYSFLNKVGSFLILAFVAATFSSCANGAASSKVSSSSNTVATSSSEMVSQSEESNSSSSGAASSSSKTSTTSKTTSTNTAAKSASTQKSESSLSATVTIDATKGGKGMLASSKKVEIKKGDSVYDALKKCCGSSIKIASKGAESSVYIGGIGGLSEFDKGSQSGWVYIVNGKMGTQSCGAFKLSGGETIKWVYTLDMGRTEAKAG